VLQQPDLVDACLATEREEVRVPTGWLRGKQLTDLLQSESELLSRQDEGEAGAIGLPVKAGRTIATGRDQAAVFIETERTQGKAELMRNLADGEGSLVFTG
jgi:hypothetical protein